MGLAELVILLAIIVALILFTPIIRRILVSETQATKAKHVEIDWAAANDARIRELYRSKKYRRSRPIGT